MPPDPYESTPTTPEEVNAGVAAVAAAEAANPGAGPYSWPPIPSIPTQPVAAEWVGGTVTVTFPQTLLPGVIDASHFEAGAVPITGAAINDNKIELAAIGDIVGEDLIYDGTELNLKFQASLLQVPAFEKVVTSPT